MYFIFVVNSFFFQFFFSILYVLIFDPVQDVETKQGP